MINVYAMILCGGPGGRLWPESTAANPKPFIDLLGARSLFQETVARMARVAIGRPPVIVTGRAYVNQVRRQLSEIGSGGRIIAEPEGRDSGPALLAAALWIAREDPEAVVVAVASDHHIPDPAAFAEAVHEVLAAAREGEIVTFGVRPASPATGYGYIRPGQALSARSAVARVGQFVEKPDAARAEALVAEGCLWNSGNFVFGVRSLLAEAKTHAPDLLRVVGAAVDAAVDRDGVVELGPSFSQAQKLSVDVAIMEKTSRAAVLPIGYAWTDLGSWDAVWESSERDQAGNAISGSAIVRGSEGCLVRVDRGGRVVALGLKNLTVVVKGCDVLVSERARAGELKPALEALERLPPARSPQTSERVLAETVIRLDGWLREKALPMWWCFGADHEHGGFHEQLTQNLEPEGVSRRCGVQARQVHVYASAGLMGWPGPWRAAVKHGLDYLWSCYRRPDGLFRPATGQGGGPADDRALLRDQALVLLALATAAKALPTVATDLNEKGLALASAIRRTFSHAGGGFIAREGEGVFLGNALMHLFEAAQAWEQADDDAFGGALAGELAAHFLDRLYEPDYGRIREVFDQRWRPAPEPEGRVLEPGHHFEWARLMEQWGVRHENAPARSAARELYRCGERGVDPVSGLVCDALLDDFTILSSASRFWPQTERVRAAALLDGMSSPLSPPPSLLPALAAMEAHLDTSTPGLWRETLRPRAGEDAASASSLSHILGAIAGLERVRRSTVPPTAPC